MTVTLRILVGGKRLSLSDAQTSIGQVISTRWDGNWVEVVIELGEEIRLKEST